MAGLRTIVIAAADDLTRKKLSEVWDTGDIQVIGTNCVKDTFSLLLELSSLDAFIIDSAMPEEIGISYTTLIKAARKFKRVAVMVIADRDDRRTMDVCMGLGVDDFIDRYVDQGLFKNRVSRILHTKYLELGRDEILGQLFGMDKFYKKCENIFFNRHRGIEYSIFYFSIGRIGAGEEKNGIDGVNDILSEVAGVLKKGLGDSGCMARQGESQFVCCVVGSRKDYYRYVYNALNQLSEAYQFFVSCGIYAVDNTNISVASMCDRAKFAESEMQHTYEERLTMYDSDIAGRYLKEQKLLADMERGLDRGEFYVVFQPVFDAATARPVSAEALLRWNHPVYGTVKPRDFIPLAERAGIISRLDLCAWEKACRLQAELKSKNIRPNPISVNVSRYDMYDEGFMDVLDCLIEKYGLTREDIRLEITETAYMEKQQEVVELVTRLKDSGYEILMDDFGSGYSSLNMLKEIPVNTLKIDMRFLFDLEKSWKGGSILIGVIRMAKMLGIGTVAEGVENAEQLSFLRLAGCDMIQGYFLSKPVSADQYIDFLSKESEKPASDNPFKRGVLVVDDLVIDRMVLKRAMGDEYRYFEAADGREALEILNGHANEISLIVSDVFMPVMNGVNFIQEVKNHPLLSHIPIVVATSDEDRDLMMKILDLGVVDVLSKPYDPVITGQRIRNILKITEFDWLQMEAQLAAAPSSS